ncbi:MAG: serine hydrolase [Caulobacter sp.]|nr:serine hydrolase [Caulobacter sp.]
MSKLTLGVAALIAAFACAAPALAAPIFVDDFQDGQADGWAAAGAGDVRLTTYQGNVSLRFTRQAEAVTTVSTRGFGDVAMAASLAGQSLGRNDACLAETSTDGGASWRTIVRLADGADDGVTLARGAVSPAGADDNARLLIRFRAAGGLRTLCWGDAVTVTGEPLATGRDASRGVEAALSGAAFTAPVDLSAFAPPPVTLPPSGRASWRLTLDVDQARFNLKVLKDETGDTPAETVARATLPAFDFTFVQDGGWMIPRQRGPVVSDHSEWDWVVEPGQVWLDAAAPGWLRAAIPFALEERNANCLHNGVLTFRFKPDGTVSPVVFEIASETCAYFKFDAWGLSPARLFPDEADGADAVATAYAAEVAGRLPVRPIALLGRLYPDLDLTRLTLAPSVDGDPPTAYGLVADGVHYAGPCRTRRGDYPFCAALDLPSYSTAKSMVGGVGLMRLEALYPGSADALISDHVPACARNDWAGVTLTHALDMTTGLYGSTAYEADENAGSTNAFFEATDHAAKVAYACGHYGRRAAPGRTFVYHTTDTYLLGAAMTDILRDRGGGDLYGDLVAPLWRSLGLSPTIMSTRRTADGVRQPFTGWGVTYTSDDVVRIVGWLADGARLGGAPALDEGLLAAALQRDPTDAGVPAGGANYRYKGGFWARNLAPVLGCDKPLWVPFMSGYGGISVVLLPGDITFYYFGDSGVFDWAPAAVEASKIKRMCP